MSNKKTMIDWSHFETRSERGTLLIRSTIEGALTDLDVWAFNQRTGVDMANSPWLISWKSVLGKVKMLDEHGALSIDRAKLIKLLEDDLDGWEDFQKKKPLGGGLQMPALDAATLKKVVAKLHSVFDARQTEEIEIGILAAFCAGLEGDIDEYKTWIKAAARMQAQLFSVGAGAAPRVRRLTTTKGRPTGLEAFDNSRTPRPAGSSANDEKTISKFTKTVKELGFRTKREFEEAKDKLRTQAPTVGQLRNYMAEKSPN